MPNHQMLAAKFGSNSLFLTPEKEKYHKEQVEKLIHLSPLTRFIRPRIKILPQRSVTVSGAGIQLCILAE